MVSGEIKPNIFKNQSDFLKKLENWGFPVNHFVQQLTRLMKLKKIIPN